LHFNMRIPLGKRSY